MHTRVLAFEDVSWAADGALHLRPFDFDMGQGEAALIAGRPGDRGVPFGDLAEGLVEPAGGGVQFQGVDWRTYAPHAAAAARGSIRRIFAAGGWLSNLDVDENITLSERHHTARPAAEIVAEAEAWARHFGLEQLPHVRPALLEPGILRRAEWVRAFMGQPALIILEDPLRDVYTDHRPALMQALREARERGAAILWLTTTPDDLRELEPVARWRVDDGACVKIPGV